jgi:Na+-driven multidrug efflux pump
MSSADLTQGRVATALLRVAAPMSLGLLSIMLTVLADAFFLGRYGQEELAAIGFVYPVIIAVTSLGIGLSAGAIGVAIAGGWHGSIRGFWR